MQLFAAALILVSVQALSCDANVITTRIPVPEHSLPENTEVKSINDLKENLRKNNDDYIDKASSISSLASTIAKVTSKLLQNESSQPAIRRAYGMNMTVGYKSLSKKQDLQLKYKDMIFSSRYPKYVNKEKSDKQVVRYRANEQGDKADQQVDNAAQQVNKAKVDKLKKFLDKYKGLVQDFISSKDAVAEAEGAGRTEPMPSAAGGALRLNVGGGAARGAAAGKDRAALRLHDDFTEQPLMRVHTTPEVRLPNAKQLDMAPAQGAKAHQLRISNRLCFRHVMIPEGPKYDSKGAVYLASYRPLRGKDYPSTRPAPLRLPRCCNCCRKSVLGCE